MNHQNMMHQFFDPQQANMNGYSGASNFQSNQQNSSSFNGPTPSSNPYMSNPNFRQQNGVSRFGSGSDNENFDGMQSPSSNQQNQQQGFPNFVDPRMGGFDSRTRPNFDPMSGGMHGFASNKMRMNDMALFNPAAMAAFQRQRMGMFPQGRENEFMSPNNPFAGFTTQQAANYMQQQRYAAFQRQMQEQMSGLQGANRGQFPPNSTAQVPSSTNETNTSSTSGNNKTTSTSSVAQADGNFPAGFQPKVSQAITPSPSPSQTPKDSSLQSNTTQAQPQDSSSSEQPLPPTSQSQSTLPNTSNTQGNDPSKFGPGTPNTPGSGSNTPKPQFEQQGQGNDSQRNAAMLAAAAAVRAAAIASSRGPRAALPPNHMGPNNYPFGPPGFPGKPEQMPSPYGPGSNVQSPEFGVMSPNKDLAMNSMGGGMMNQGRRTPRSVPPPPYSPMPQNNEKGSMPNLAATPKASIKTEENAVIPEGKSEKEKETSRNTEVKSAIKIEQPGDNFTNAKSTQQKQQVGNSVKISAPPPPTAISVNNAQTNNVSPAPSPFQDDGEFDNLSPSWPNTPLSPNAQKILKQRASPKQYDQLSKVYDLIVDEEKRNFLDRYLAFMSVNGTPVTKLPVIGKQPLDLYTLFRAVCERGGIQEVMEKRSFRDILTCLGLPNGNVPLAYMVKEQYMKYLHAYEIKAKDMLLKQWEKKPITLNTTNTSTANTPSDTAPTAPVTTPAITTTTEVPTIALNDSLQPEMKLAVQNQTLSTSDSSSSQSWNNNYPPISAVNTSAPSTSLPTSIPSNQMNPRMSYPNQNPMSTFNQQSMNSFGGGQEMPPGYPGYGGYQNPMFQRPPGPMQNFNSMRPGMSNDSMGGNWPRGFSPRQGPPELFPEGLQRMPWNQGSQQRHPMSAFATPNFPSNKTRGQMPPITRDSLEQMKYNAQQQLKMQQFHQQQQQQQQPQPQQAHPQIPNQQQQQLQGQPPQQQQSPRPQIPNTQGKLPKRFNSPNPKMLFKGNKMAAPELKPQLTPTHSLKREFNFPPNSVEATKPVLKKRKKLTSKDLGPVEAWRIMMSLKSGLVAECTWAIDMLNILLADNSTITYFHLNQLPGLLDTLMDHYRRSINNMFEEFNGVEIPLLPETTRDVKDGEQNIDKKLTDLWVGVCKNSKNSYSSNIASRVVAASMQESLNASKDFWQRGGGDNTSHLQTSFPTSDVKLKAFPKGMTYVTKAEEEKQRKLVRPSSSDKKQTNSSSVKKERSHENNRIEPPKESVNSPPDRVTSPTPESTKDVTESTPINCTKTSEPSVGCMRVIDDLLDECDKETDENAKDPLISKLLRDLEFSIPCDKKYLDDSKEFIEYLNRRLQRENRGNVKSEQCIVKQTTPFVGVLESENSLLRRCVALSNVFRSLSFIQGNDTQLANHAGLMSVCAFVILHKHEHAITDHSQFRLGFDERTVPNNALCDNELSDNWWQSLFSIRENTLVMLANIGGHLNLTRISENIRVPLVKGLIHWLVCHSSQALDPMPTAPGSHALSAQRLCMETLAKLTINTQNIDVVVSNITESVLEEVGSVLVKNMGRKSLVPNREFAIILLDNLSQAEQFSKVLATRKSAIRNICTFLYDAEKNTSNYLSSGGRVQPGLNAEEICGTSISLLRRAVNILLSIAKIPSNRSILTPYTEDLLTLSTSQMIDTSVLALLAAVLFELST